MDLYIKNGKPLQLSGTTVYSRSGKVVGRIKGDKVFGTDERYVGSIVGDRLAYRSTQRSSLANHWSSRMQTGGQVHAITHILRRYDRKRCADNPALLGNMVCRVVCCLM